MGKITATKFYEQEEFKDGDNLLRDLRFADEYERVIKLLKDFATMKCNETRKIDKEYYRNQLNANPLITDGFDLLPLPKL
jgi:hypothetical protein